MYNAYKSDTPMWMNMSFLHLIARESANFEFSSQRHIMGAGGSVEMTSQTQKFRNLIVMKAFNLRKSGTTLEEQLEKLKHRESDGVREVLLSPKKKTKKKIDDSTICVNALPVDAYMFAHTFYCSYLQEYYIEWSALCTYLKIPDHRKTVVAQWFDVTKPVSTKCDARGVVPYIEVTK